MKKRKKTDISVEKAKQILTTFFEGNGYYLWRDNLAQSDTENHSSLLFVTDKRYTRLYKKISHYYNR